MAFKPFGFTFTPPQTVQEPTLAPPPTIASGPTVGGPNSGAQSVAGQLISQLDDLTAMSQYLQDVIVARTNKIAIEIVSSVDPIVGKALTSIYGVDTPPSFVTMAMYDALLDAHIGAIQLEMSVGNDSTIQPNPFAVGDITTVVNAVNKALVNSPSYANWLPLQLAPLKGDSVIFQSWKQALQSYPAYYSTTPLVPETYQPSTIKASTLDVSPDIAAYHTDALNRIGQAYSIIYVSLATTSAVEVDISSAVTQCIQQPLQNVLRIVALLNSLVGLIHKQSMDDLQSDPINYSFIRLAADTSGMLATVDQLVSLAVTPLLSNLSGLGQILAAAQSQEANVGTVSGTLAGLSAASSCAAGNPVNGVPTTANLSLSVPGLGVISPAVKALGEIMNWGMNATQESLSLIDKSFRQLTERRINAQNNLNSLMCSIRTIGALISVVTSVANTLQKGTVSPNSTPQQLQDATNGILNSLQTGSNTTFTASGSQVIVNPPTMPSAPPRVVSVLQRSNIHPTIGSIKT